MHVECYTVTRNINTRCGMCWMVCSGMRLVYTRLNVYSGGYSLGYHSMQGNAGGYMKRGGK